MTKKRNVNLDGLKLLACFAVIGLHVFTYNYNNTIITYIHYMCGYAVPIFFLVNGYLILNKKEVTYTYTAKKILKILFLVVLWNLFFIEISYKTTIRKSNNFSCRITNSRRFFLAILVFRCHDTYLPFCTFDS